MVTTPSGHSHSIPACSPRRVAPRGLGVRAGALLLAATLAACTTESGTSDAEPENSSPTASGSATTTAAGEPTPAASETALPPGALGRQAGWLLGLLGPEAKGPTSSAAERRFAKQFLSQASAPEIKTLFRQLRSVGPFTVTAVEPVTKRDAVSTTTLRLAGEEALVMEVSVAGDGRIAGLFFRPDPDATPVPVYDSFEGLSEDLESASTAHVYAAEVAGGRCATTYEDPEGAAAAPSGSVFKLVVLSALVDAVAADDLDWDDQLVITENVKSLPSGRLQDEPTGSRVSVREAAGLMISISDNTAADLLLTAVGEDRIQDTVADLELSDDSLDPFLTTRQLFLLGWGAPDLAELWSDADAGERRDLLGRLPKRLSSLDPAQVTTPVWSQGIGWFFTGAEICGMHARLQQQADTPAGAPVRDILAENPGVPVPEGIDYLAFKGGSVPGVLALSYLAEPTSGPARVLVVQVFGDAAINTAAVVSATRGGLALLP